MVFSSLEFIFRFLPIFLIVYYLTPDRHKNIPLMAGSLIFYALGEPVYIVLILLSILINFRLGLAISRHPRQPYKRYFIFMVSIVYNFGMLFIFKYSNFIIDNLNSLTAFLHTQGLVSLPAIPHLPGSLPLGISFYTFQIVSYIIDVYKGRQRSVKSILNLGTYLCMFPQLIAGPIIVYQDISKEIAERHVSLEDFEEGLKTFVLGLGSKVLLANRISTLWNDIQVTGFESISTPLAWMGAFAYSFHIFFDFFGYSLMAIGLGRMLGFPIPENFNYPYVARSVSEFWRRWHITLGKWFREYIYIPLGGNRKGMGKTIRNLLVVWLLTGLWHGANWNFIIWGLLFFVLIALEKLFLGKVWKKLPPLGHLYVIFLIPLTWMVFAVTDLSDLGTYFTRLFPFINGSSINGMNVRDYLDALNNYLPLFILCVLFSTPLPAKIYRRFRQNVVTLLFLLAVFWLSVYQLVISVNNPFLYFRF